MKQPKFNTEYRNSKKKRWWEHLSTTGIVIGTILLIGVISYFSWKGERWLNWKMGYSKDVAAEIAPLKQEIIEMKKEIKELRQLHNLD